MFFPDGVNEDSMGQILLKATLLVKLAAISSIPRWGMMRVLEAKPKNKEEHPKKKYGFSSALNTFDEFKSQIGPFYLVFVQRISI